MQLGDHEAAGGAAGAAVEAEVGAHDEHLAGVVVAVAHDPLQQPAHAVGEVGEGKVEAPVAPAHAGARHAGGVRQAAWPARPGRPSRRCRPRRDAPEGRRPAGAPARGCAGGGRRRRPCSAGLSRPARRAPSRPPGELRVFVGGHEAAIDQARSGGPQHVGLGAVGEQQEQAALDVGARAEAGIDRVDPSARDQRDVDAERGQPLDAGAQFDGGGGGAVRRRRRPLQTEDAKGASQVGLRGIGGSRQLHRLGGRGFGRVIPAPRLSYATVSATAPTGAIR